MDNTYNAISDSLFNTNIYSVYSVKEEGPGSSHSELAALRQRFFEGGRKKAKFSNKSDSKGYKEKIKGMINKHKLKWKKTTGPVAKEEAFYINKNYVVVIRDLNGNVTSKITYDKNMLWTKTEYFRTDDYVTPHTILKPRLEDDSIEQFVYDYSEKRYHSVILYPIRYEKDSPQQSMIDAEHGENNILLFGSKGSFCYCPKDEQAAGLESLEAMERSTIMMTAAWEVKDGEVPAGAIEIPLEDEEVPEVETDTSEETHTADAEVIISETAPENEGVTEAVIDETSGQITEEDLSIQLTETPAVTPVNEISDLGVRHNYVGSIVRGKREGRGRTEQNNGLTVFDGEYKNDMKDGFGASYYADGDMSYVGGWKEDKKNGLGISFRKNDHSLHISGWTDGKADSYTTLIDTEGNLRYSGKIIDGKKQGAGVTYRREDDTIFVARYVDGQASSYGSLFDKDGTLIYSGEWKDGKRSGIGTEFGTDGQVVYSGEWKDDRYYNGMLYRKVNPEK